MTHPKLIKGRPLTPIELKVLRRMCNGDTDQEAATILGITVNATKSHAIRIRDKLNINGSVTNRIKMVLKVLRDPKLIALMRAQRDEEGESK